MGPDIPGGARQATPEELATMSARGERLRSRYETVLAQTLAEHGEQLLSTADELLANGQATATVGAVDLHAELLTYWRGDRILRIERTTGERSSAGSSLARFPRHDRPDSREIIMHNLASSLASELVNE